MFKDVPDGGVPCYPTSGAPGPDGVVEGVPLSRQAAGPLPTRPDGSFFVDRNGPCFQYVLDFLRGGLATDVALSAASSSADMWQLTAEARFYWLDDLAEACAAAAPPAPVTDFQTLVAACGVRGADILALSQVDLTEQLKELGVKLAMAVRVRSAVEQERERVRLEDEAERARIAALAEQERAFETLRGALRQIEAGVSDAGVRTLAALGFALPQVCELDAARARELGLSAEDARLVDALQPPPNANAISDAALTLARVVGSAQGQGTRELAHTGQNHAYSTATGGEVLNPDAAALYWKATIASGSRFMPLGVIGNGGPGAMSYGDATTFAWAGNVNQVYIAGKNHAGHGGFAGWQDGDVAVFKLEAHQLSMQLQRLPGRTFTINTNAQRQLRVYASAYDPGARVTLSQAAPGEQF